MVQCKPERILGTAGTGAVLSLDAIGMQDPYLTGGPSDAPLFQFKGRRHTPFTKYYASRVLGNPGNQTGWPFGQTIHFQMNPRTMGDVLSNMYLKIDAPDTKNYCTSKLGWAMISSLEFRIDSQVIETIPGDWNIMYAQLQYTAEQQKAVETMVRGPHLYVPLNFFFTRVHGSQRPHFLTCAAYANRTIDISITFNPATFFTRDGICTLDSVSLVTEEFTLSHDERMFMQSSKQTQLLSYVTNNPTETATAPGPFSINLTPNIPVTALYWFLRDTDYENATDTTYFDDRYNFSNNYYAPEDESAFPIVSETQLYLNGKQVLAVSKSNSDSRLDGSNYFKFAQPMDHGLTVPKRNVYTYSFALRPKETSPTGAVDFSQMNSGSTKLAGTFFQGVTGTYSINVYYSGFHELTYENGYASLTYAPT